MAMVQWEYSNGFYPEIFPLEAYSLWNFYRIVEKARKMM
ncbi:hypothetical protein B488_04440 [Liberibacter crescens BT-1]|uniref:Uncharacterized protein n=1 Tax=Liberibacter crescens (strain BT-1) TaxID=1215343 RepID=L0EVL7_LIBCB|nr:hypothetical protein B488_04440 [Liberibacter crescens BT-1]